MCSSAPPQDDAVVMAAAALSLETSHQDLLITLLTASQISQYYDPSNSMDESQVLGRGSFGVVYKGLKC